MPETLYRTDAVLAVDIGTTSTKGSLVNSNGTVLQVASRKNAARYPARGCVEHDAEGTWWQSFVKVCRELLSGAQVRLRAVCVTGLGPCLLPTSESADPLRPAISYGIDTRAVAEIAAIERHLGSERVIELCGHSLTSQSVGPKMLWLREHEPQVWSNTDLLLSSHTFIVRRLTGQYVLDHTSASMWDPLYDGPACNWHRDQPQELFSEIELPDLRWPAEIVGETRGDWAAEAGIPAGVPVVAGCIDCWADNVGAGADGLGDCMIAYGTTMAVGAIANGFHRSDALLSTPGSYPGRYSVGGPISHGGGLLDWVRHLVNHDSHDDLVEQATHLPAGANGLVVLPYLGGERAPIHDPHSRGLICGLTLHHGAGHLYKAALEATAYSVRHVIDEIRSASITVSRYVASGGGVTHPTWLQIMSDVLGEPQCVPTVPNTTTFGGAVLAARGVGILGQQEHWTRHWTEIKPNIESHNIYENLYTIYRGLSDTTRATMHQLDSLTE